MPSLPWRSLAVLSLLGTLAVVAFTLQDFSARGGRNPLSLIQPGAKGPSREAIEHDFPDADLPPGLGHDGQQFYAIARAPMHLDEAAEQLDRPRYRLQRPVLPWLAWAAHPTGGGTGLIWAIFAVNVGALFAAGLAGGALSVSWHGPRWVAAVIPLLPVGYASLRISVADMLALALVLCALAADVRGRTAIACLLATAAALSKESILVVVLGWALTRLSRSSVLVLLASGGVAFGWWLALHALVDSPTASVVEFGAPFRGLTASFERWSSGDDLWAAAAVIGGLVSGASALTRRWGHPLTGGIVLSLLFIVPLNVSVLGLDFNGMRAIGPLTALALIAWATPNACASPAKRTITTTS